MDLIERIETTRFLGAEFLVWLWFCSETFDGKFVLDAGPLELWLDSPLSLESQLQPGERIALRGIHPSATAEAKEALRQNKLPTRARLVLRTESHEFALVLDAATLGVSGASVPAVLSRDSDEAFLERMTLLDTLHRTLDELFASFVRQRLDVGWEKRWVPAMASWMREEPIGAALLRGLTADRASGGESQKRKGAGRPSGARPA